MALREATELLGTHEGAAKLAEAKRYSVLADEIERLREHAVVLAATTEEVERERCVAICSAQAKEADGDINYSDACHDCASAILEPSG